MAQREQDWNDRQLAAPVAAPHWKLWTYDAPAIVLGCTQKALMPGQGAIPVLMRRSGGGAVLTGPWMIGLSVILPARHPLLTASPVASYRWLGMLLAKVLMQAGIAAVAAAPECVAAPLHIADWACFAGLSPWEVTVRDRKIAGLAQRRCRTGTLLAAGLLLGTPDWALLCRTLRQPPGDAIHFARHTTSVAQEDGRANIPALLSALEDELDRLLAEASLP